MESFCETNSPGLFNIIEKSIKSHYSATVDSERRTGLRRSRVVGELHRLAYLRNQVRKLVTHLYLTMQTTFLSKIQHLLVMSVFICRCLAVLKRL